MSRWIKRVSCVVALILGILVVSPEAQNRTWVLVNGVMKYTGTISYTIGLAGDGSASAPSIAFANQTNTGWYRFGASDVRLSLAGTDTLIVQPNLVGIASQTGSLFFGTGADVILTRDGAGNILAMKNGANAQTFRIYGTTTGPKYLSLSHDGTNGVIDTAASSGLISIAPTNATSVTIGKKLTSYNAIATSGNGIPAIVSAGSGAAISAAADTNRCSFTPGADGDFEVSDQVLVTTAGSIAATATVGYTDEGSTARTQTIPFVLVAGSAIVTAIAAANGTVPYNGIPLHIRAKSGVAINISTTGTFTGSVYNHRCAIRQLQ